MEKVINLQKEGEEKVISLTRENITIGGGAVDSVNGMTGDVVLTTSDLENTSDYQTGTQVSTAINTAVAAETSAREAADTNLQSQIDGITASSDVTDIVGTYADLQAYDTSKLGDNDIIKVLQDESRNDETTYYRWDAQTQSFTLIGEEGPYYTKSQTDALLNAKQNTLTAGQNISINNNVISATDTTYETFVGTDGTEAGEAGLVPAPATTDIDKFLKSDGTWGTVSGGGGDTVYSDKTTSINNTGGAVYIGNLNANQEEQPDPTVTDTHDKYFWVLPVTNTEVPGSGSINIMGEKCGAGVCIGFRSTNGGTSSSHSNVVIGNNATVTGSYDSEVVIGANAYAARANNVLLGADTNSGIYQYSVALGRYATIGRKGEVNVGLGTHNNGFNSTPYRVIGGVYDGQVDHDAVTVSQVNATIDAINAALSTSIPHIGA